MRQGLIQYPKHFKTRGPRWHWIAHLNFWDYPGKFFFFFFFFFFFGGGGVCVCVCVCVWPFREEFTRISLCLYSASSPHSLILCVLTKFRKHFLKRVTQGTFLWNYFKIWPVVSEKKIFKDFVHACIVKVAPIHQSHVHERIKISLTIFETGRSRNISANWGLEATYCVVLTYRTCYWTNWTKPWTFDLIIFVYLSSLPVAHLSDTPRRRLAVMGDSARIQDETTENSVWFFNVLGV